MARMTLEDIEKITGNPTKLTLQDIEKITGNPTVTQTSAPQRTSKKTQKIPSLSSNVGDPGYKKKSGRNLYIGETIGGDDVARMAKKNKVGSYSSIRPENSARLRKSEPEEKEEAFLGRGSAQNNGVQDSSVGLRKSSNQTKQTSDNKQQSGSFDESRLDEYADPSYKLNAQEQKEAKKFIQDYYKNTPGLSGGILKAVGNARQRANWSKEEQEKYEKVVALENKLSSGSAIMAGIAGAFDTFTAPLEKMAQNVTKSFTGEDTDVEGKLEEQMEGTKRQHPIASTAGNIGGQMAKYAMGSTLAGQIPALGKAANTIGRTVGGAAEKALSGVGGKLAGIGGGAVANVGGKLLSGGAKRIGEQVARSASNIAGDMTLDLALDTIPRISENAREGMSAGEIAADAGRNIAQNLGWNVLGEAGGVAMERIPEISQYFRRRNKSGTGTVDIPKDADVSTPFSVADEAKVKGGSAQINSNAENVTQKAAKNAVPTNRKETVSEKEILNIINDENLRRTFTEQTGVQLSGSRDDMAKTIRETLSDSFGPKEVEAMDRANAADITAENTARRAAEIESGKRSALDELKKNLSEYNMSDENRKRASSLLDEMSKIQDQISVGKDSTPVYEQLIEKSTELDRLLRETATRTTVDEFSKKAYDDVVSYLRSTGKSIYVSPKAAAEFPDGVRSLNQQFSSYGRGISFTTNREKGIPLDTIMGDMEQLTGFRGSGNDIDDLKNLTEYLARNKAGRTVQEPYTGGAVSEFIENATKPFNAAMDMSDLTSSGNPLKVSKTRTNTLPKSGLLTETEMAKYAPEDMYRYAPVSEKESMSEAALRISANAEGWKQRIMEQESLDGKDLDTLMMLYRDNVTKARANNDTALWDEASTLLQKIQKASSRSGQQIQALAKWSRNTPEGAIVEGMRKISSAVDKKYGKGYSAAVDNLAERVEEVVKNSATLQEAEKEVKALLEMNLQFFADDPKTVKGALKGKDKILEAVRKGEDYSVIGQIVRKENTVYLSANEQKEIYSLLSEAMKYDPQSRQSKELTAKAAKMVAENIPASFGSQVKSVLYNNMLGNFKTALSRNAFGNAAYNTLEQLRQPLAATIDRAVSLGTKKRTTSGWTKDKTVAYIRGLARGFTDELKDIRQGVNTSRRGFDTFADAVDANKKAFNGKNAISKFTNGINNIVSHGMSMGDRPFYEAAYEQSKAELNSLISKYGDRVLAKKSREGIDEFIDSTAKLKALEAVFQDDSVLYNALKGFKESAGKLSEGVIGVDLLSQTSSPFIKTPGNMLSRALEYSPFGVVKNAVNTVAETRIPELGGFNQRRFVDETSRNLMGTGILAGAIAAAQKGLTTGSYSDDLDEAQAQRNAGMLEYAIQLPDGRQVDAGDIPVIGPMIEAGAKINDQGLAKGATQALGAIVGGSAMQGINRLFGGNSGYSSNQENIFDNAIDTLASSVTQLAPSLGRQIAQTMDPYKRDMGEYGTLEYYGNMFKNQIPVLRQTLPIKYDEEGNPVLQNQGRGLGDKIFENFLAPMNVSEYKPSDLTQEASRLLESTGENIAFVPKANRSDVKKWYGDDFTEDKFRDYKKKYGEAKSAVGNALMKSKTYQNMDDVEKAGALQDAYSAVKAAIKADITGEEPKDKLAQIYREDGMEKMITYMGLNEEASQFHNSDGSEKTFAGATQAQKMDILDRQDMTPAEKGAYMFSSSDSDAVKNTHDVYGDEGVYNFFKIKQAADVEGDGSFSVDAAVSYLDRQNYSDKEKGFYMYQLGKEGKTRDRFYSGKGYEGVYDYYKIRSEADYNGNGNLAQSEVIPYLSSEDFPREVKRLYFSWLFPNAKENPF